MGEMILFLLPPLTVCGILIILLGYLGIHVLKREIIFIDIALAQIAAVGATLAHVFFAAEEQSLLAYICAFGFTVIASIFFSQIDKRITQISHEAIIGVSYAIAAASALFILALAAGGDVHMEHMLTGSILWAKWSDILFCTVIFAFVGLFHIVFYKRFRSLSENARRGENKSRTDVLWDFLFYMSMGLIITVSVKIAGVLVVFSFLIIPATFSALFSHTWKNRITISWVFAIISVVIGLLFSYWADFSVGPTIMSILGLILIIGGILKRFRMEKYQ